MVGFPMHEIAGSKLKATCLAAVDNVQRTRTLAHR